MKGKKVSKLVAAMLLASLVPFGISEAKADENVDPSQTAKQAEAPQDASENKQEQKPAENPTSSDEIFLPDGKLDQIMKNASFTEEEIKTKDGWSNAYKRIRKSESDLSKERNVRVEELKKLKDQVKYDLSDLEKADKIKRDEMLLESQITEIDKTIAGSEELTQEELANPRLASFTRGADDPYIKDSTEHDMETMKIEKEFDDLLDSRAVRENQPKIGEEVRDEQENLWNKMEELRKKAEPIENKAEDYNKRYVEPFSNRHTYLDRTINDYTKAINKMADDLRKQGIDPETDPKYIELNKTNSKIIDELSEESWANFIVSYKNRDIYYDMRKDADLIRNESIMLGNARAINRSELKLYKDFKEGKITAENIDSILEKASKDKEEKRKIYEEANRKHDGVLDSNGAWVLFPDPSVDTFTPGINYEDAKNEKRLYERYKDYFENGNKETDKADLEYKEIIKKKEEYQETLAQRKKVSKKMSEEHDERTYPSTFLVKMRDLGKTKPELIEDLNKQKAELQESLKTVKEKLSKYDIGQLEDKLSDSRQKISDKEESISAIDGLMTHLSEALNYLFNYKPNEEPEDNKIENDALKYELGYKDLFYKYSDLKEAKENGELKNEDELQKAIDEIREARIKHEKWLKKRVSLERLKRAHYQSKNIVGQAELEIYSGRIKGSKKDKLIKLIAKQKEINKRVEKYIQTLRAELYKQAKA